MDRNVILMERDIPGQGQDASLIYKDGKNVFGKEEAWGVVEEEINGIKAEEESFSNDTFTDRPRTELTAGMTRSDGAWWSFSIVPLDE